MEKTVSIPVFTLCDGATSREGLLNILGAGITEVNCNDEFPAPIGAILAAVVTFGGKNPTPPRLSISISTHDGNKIGIEDFEIGPGDETPPSLTEGPLYTIPLIINVSDLALPAAGRYRFTLSDGGDASSSIEFNAS